MSSQEPEPLCANAVLSMTVPRYGSLGGPVSIGIQAGGVKLGPFNFPGSEE